jgi:hypothetical protein
MMKHENYLVDFLLSEPMEMREFLDSHQKLNFFTKWIIKIRAYFTK